jgi:dephospho-CoA kinase
MLRVGLTGGYATGKSFVASELEKRGCCLIYADRLGHEVMAPGGPAYRPIVERFGAAILGPDGAIDRKLLAAIVFGNEELLEQLNGIVHPAVFDLEEALLAKFIAIDPRAIVVMESAILIETGRYKAFDRLILTTCPESLQVSRGMKRDRLPRSEVLKRIHNQMPLDKKEKFADFVIETSRSKAETAAQVAVVYQTLKSLATDTTKNAL